MERKAPLSPLKAQSGRKGPRSQLLPWLESSTVSAAAGVVGLVFSGVVVGLYHFFYNFLFCAPVTKARFCKPFGWSQGCGLWLHNRS